MTSHSHYELHERVEAVKSSEKELNEKKFTSEAK